MDEKQSSFEQDILLLIETYTQRHGSIPRARDLVEHKAYAGFFTDLSSDEYQIIERCVDTYLRSYLSGLKTKGGQLIARMYDVHYELCSSFRAMEKDDDRFQSSGRALEQIVYEYETTLTQGMMHKEMGLQKTIEAFYDIIYMLFLYYGAIRAEE